MSSFRSLLSFAFVASLLSCGPVEHETISGMSQIVTPPAVPNFPPSLNIPTNGDGLDAAVFKLGVEDPLQAGVEAARLAVLGGGIRRRVVCASNSSLTVYPIGTVVATVGGTTWAVPHSVATVLDPSALVSLANNTRYWVYAQLSAANPPVLNFIISTDAPTTPGLAYRTGDASSLYVSTFATDSSSNIIKYDQDDSHFTFNNRYAAGGGVKGNHVVDNDSSLGPTTVSVASCVPTMAMSFRVQVQLSGTSDQVIVTQTGNSVPNFTLKNDDTQKLANSSTMSANGGLSFIFAIPGAVGTVNADVEEFWL